MPTEHTVLLCGACGQVEPVGYDGTCCTWPMMLVSASDPRVIANGAGSDVLDLPHLWCDVCEMIHEQCT